MTTSADRFPTSRDQVGTAAFYPASPQLPATSGLTKSACATDCQDTPCPTGTFVSATSLDVMSSDNAKPHHATAKRDPTSYLFDT
jgi:hypothetical protein